MGANSSFPENSQQMARAAFSRLSHAYTVSDTDINIREKKKKASKFTTLRKKLTRARRHSRSFDYGKAVRDLTSSWPFPDLNALTQEYEALAALKELAIAANVARPAANVFRQDWAHMFEQKFCTDIDLVYRGACFPAHRALLSIRSPYFRNLLARFPDFGSQIPVNFKTSGVDVTLFAALLRYLYTDSINTEDLKHEHRKVLQKLAEEFGLPNPLEQDMRNLLESGDYRDAVLVFSCDAATDSLDCMSVSEPGLSDLSYKSSQHELVCHKAILAARSPFFRNLLLRRARSGEELTEQSLHTPSRIVLDESVIPRRYARVLLNAIYTDTVDLSMILKGSASMCSLSEVQAIVAGKGQMTVVDEAMEVYQIGQFLDFPVLSQGCEDIIVDNICIDNLLTILNWSAEPHGSQWVHRQALHYLREEFLQVAHSPVFLELTKDYLIEAFSSDFLQAGEQDVLVAALRWGEHQLIKRIEEREPNILSHTTHSISKKGVKKRDLNDIELRDILAEILPLVRIDHVLPSNCDALISAIRRGLVSTPPSHMLEDDGHGSQICAWIRGKSSSMFMRPRLFTPYFEEAKSLRDEHLSQGQDIDAGRVRTIQMSSIPDTLYMVEESLYPQTHFHGNTSSSTVDIIAGTIPVPDTNTLKLMMRREQELQQSKLTQRAYSLPYSDKRAINCQLQLRTVREFGLPDTTVEILQNSQFYYCNEPRTVPQQLNISRGHRYNSSPVKRKSSPPLSRRSRHANSNKPVQCVTPTRSQACSKENSTVPCNESSSSALSDIMPDIAMATSSIGQIRLHEEFELDIGDESHTTMYI